MINNEDIQSVRDRIDIVEVAQKLVPGLKQAGASWKGKSPFTEEKSPSFFVAPAKGIFKCFSTGKGGDAFTLIQEVERCEWLDAVKWAADFYKIELREVSSINVEEAKEKATKAQQAEKLMKSCLNRWRESAENSSDFKAWIAERKFTEDDIAQWGIAHAPSEWRYLSPKIIDSGYFAIAQEIGLVKSKEEKVYDSYRNRIIFPIHGKKGALIGFAGRILGDNKEEAKYINPSESFVYDKSGVLYGWHFAERSIRQSKTAHIVEGYVDVIAMHRVMLTNTVASCGTAITSPQAAHIARNAQRVVILMDGDKAGIKAARRAIEVFLPTGIEVKVCTLPEGKDPDDLIRSVSPEVGDGGLLKLSEDEAQSIGQIVSKEIEEHTKDALNYLIDLRVGESMSPKEKAEFNKEIGALIGLIPDEATREEYTKACASSMGITARALSKIVDKKVNDLIQESMPKKQERRKEETEWELEEGEWFPDWAIPHVRLIKKQMFAQKETSDKGWPIGIYFPPIKGTAPVFMGLNRCTNFVIHPLFQIRDERNGRWLVNLKNEEEESYVEIPDAALVEQNTFLKVLVPRRCHPYPEFGKFHYQYLIAMLMKESERCYELNTLGHQPEDFFAFSNAVAVHVDGKIEVQQYDELGVVKIKNTNYMSPGVSKARIESRDDNNMYENDLYLKYVEAPVTFSEWARIFNTVYDDHGMYGISFVFLSIYKDMIYKIGAKCPLLYLYGPKGSGKSAMGESIMFLFFSGKNAEGRLIQAVNMSQGMVTDFALASALQRFRSVPRLFNEYDPSMTDIKYRGWFKAAFDGEGRERGMGDSGGRRKTEVMKVQGTVMIAGQYMDSGDDGAVMTRSINLQFSEEKNKNRTQEQKDLYVKLNELESKGLAGCITELIAIRPYIWSKLKERFYEVKKRMSIDTKKMKGGSMEERLLNNYALCYTFSELVNDKIPLPYKMLDFYQNCIKRMVELSSLISDGSVMNRFWDVVEFCIDTKQIKTGLDYDTAIRDYVTLRTSEGIHEKKWQSRKRIVFVRLGQLYAGYSKEMRARGAKGYDESTIETYLKDLPYYIGSCPRHYFAEGKETSAYVLDVEMMESLGIRVFSMVTERPREEEVRPVTHEAQKPDEELPF